MAEQCPHGVEYKALGELCEYVRGVTYNKSNETTLDNGFKILRANNIDISNNRLNFKDVKVISKDVKIKDAQKLRKDDILMSMASGSKTHVGKVAYVNNNIDYYFGGFMGVIRCHNIINSRFVFHLLSSDVFSQYIGKSIASSTINNISSLIIKKYKIPIPPLAVQEYIVSVLDKFTELKTELEAALKAELTARKKQYEYYRNKLLTFDDVEWRALGEIAENFDSKRKPIASSLREAGDIPYYGASGIVDYVKDYNFDGDFLLVSEDGANLLARSTPIAFSISGKSWVNNHAHILKFETYVERKYVEYYLNSIDLTPYILGATQPKLNKKNLNRINIPNPSPEEKKSIVSILDKFDTLVNSISEGLPREIELRQKQYEYYRDYLLSFGARRNTI